MSSAFSTFFLMLKGFLASFFGIKGTHRTAYKSLYGKHSYRLTAAQKKGFLIVLKYFIKALKYLWTAPQGSIQVSESNVALFETTATYSVSQKYLTSVYPEEKLGAIFLRDQLGISGSFLLKLFTTFFAGGLFHVLFPISFFYRRDILALSLLEYVENTLLLQHCKQQQIQKLYYLNSFELDANFGALLLMKKNIQVVKIPSSGTLKDHYQEVICSDLCFTSPYHFDEAKILYNKNNFFVERIFLLPPLELFGSDATFNKSASPINKDIGFISRGIWRRRERGDYYLHNGVWESEDQLMDYLKEYLQAHPESKLHVFCHPCEKEDDAMYEKAQQHYRSFFNNDQLIFPAKEKSTRELFDAVEIAIATNSNALHERLYCGYKVLFAPIEIQNFPVKDSSLNNISIRSKEELFQQLENNLSKDTKAYFADNDLGMYHHSSYDVHQERTI